jgi:cell division protease FtsH
MSPEMGPQSYAEREELLFLGREVSRTQNFSEETARRIDAEVNRIIRTGHDAAEAILKQNIEALHTVARLLLEKETLDGQDVVDIVQHGRILSEAERVETSAAPAAEAPAAAAGATAPAAEPPTEAS